jgi:hypothetical protein
MRRIHGGVALRRTADDYADCIEACEECIVAAEACLASLADEPDATDCLQCCRECVDICHLVVLALARDSRYTKDYARLCARICEWCANQCIERDDLYSQRCAEACRRCVDECHALLS